MEKRAYTCSVVNCGGHKTVFRFPSPRKSNSRFVRWVEATGNPKLAAMDPDKIRKRAICRKHFPASDILEYGSRLRLRESAIPCLHLPTKSIASSGPTQISLSKPSSDPQEKTTSHEFKISSGNNSDESSSAGEVEKHQIDVVFTTPPKEAAYWMQQRGAPQKSVALFESSTSPMASPPSTSFTCTPRAGK